MNYTSQPTMMLRFENGRLHQKWLQIFSDGSTVSDWLEVPTLQASAAEDEDRKDE